MPRKTTTKTVTKTFRKASQPQIAALIALGVTEAEARTLSYAGARKRIAQAEKESTGSDGSSTAQGGGGKPKPSGNGKAKATAKTGDTLIKGKSEASRTKSKAGKGGNTKSPAKPAPIKPTATTTKQLLEQADDMIKQIELEHGSRLSQGKLFWEFSKLCDGLKVDGKIKSEGQALDIISERFTSRGKKVPGKAYRSQLKKNYEKWVLNTDMNITDVVTDHDMYLEDGEPVPLSLNNVNSMILYLFSDAVTPDNVLRLLAVTTHLTDKIARRVAPYFVSEHPGTDVLDEATFQHIVTLDRDLMDAWASSLAGPDLSTINEDGTPVKPALKTKGTSNSGDFHTTSIDRNVWDGTVEPFIRKISPWCGDTGFEQISTTNALEVMCAVLNDLGDGELERLVRLQYGQDVRDESIDDDEDTDADFEVPFG